MPVAVNVRGATGALAVVVLALFLLPGFGSLNGGGGPAARSGASGAVLHAAAVPSRAVVGASAASPASGAPNSSGPQNATATGVPGWDNVTGTSGTPPPVRSYGRSFAYDPVDHYMVLFGGDGASGYMNDTWTYANGTWTQIHPTKAPSQRDHSTLAWDPVAGYLLLFGGSGNAGAYADTWTFVHGEWTSLAEATHPSARWATNLAWDAGDQEMVLFGGCAGSAVADTWTFANGNWTELSPANHPSARENTALRYDAQLNATILFGGDDYYGNYDSDTWEFKAGNWTELNLTVHPGARTEASFAYDAAVGSMVLFGGTSSAGIFSDTWLFTNGTWSAVTSSQAPPARYFGLMAYDDPASEVVLWGGAGMYGELTDTWAFVGMNLSASATVSAASGPTIVGFSASPTGGIGPFSYLWQFGDGNVSHERNVSNLYGTPGRYVASVTVTDANGSSAVANFEIRITAPLEVAANVFPLSGIAPLTVNCALLASGGAQPYSFDWSAGAGHNGSTNATATFVYGTPGTFDATAVVTDAHGASWNESFPIEVAPKVVPPLGEEISSSNLSGPAPLTVWFTGTASGGVGPYVLSWSFGDGTNGSGGAVNRTYTTVGTYPVTLTAVDARGVESNRTVNVSVTAGLAATASAPTSATANQSADFTATISGGLAPYEVVWDFGDGHASTEAATTHAYATAGHYTASVTVFDHRGAVVSQQFQISVAPAPPTGRGNGTTTTSSASDAGLATAEVYGLAIVGGAAIIAAAMLIVRRMDRPKP